MNRTAENERFILVVEDELMILTIVKSVLSSFNRVVLAASSLKKAREHWNQHAGMIDLLLSDVSLGDGSGLEFATEVLGLSPSLNVIIMTGAAYSCPELASLHEQRVKVLEKPFNVDTLKRITSSFLPEHQS
jgi:DNA-binding NtrC family response regulator